jgi:hypothetical protein
MNRPLTARRELLKRRVLAHLLDPVRYAAPLETPLPVLIEAVKTQGFEGEFVALREDKPARQVRRE